MDTDEDKKRHMFWGISTLDQNTESGMTQCVRFTLSCIYNPAGQIKIRLVYEQNNNKIMAAADILVPVTKQYPHVLSLPNL